MTWLSDVKYTKYVTRMWADAQCDSHTAEHTWRPLLNAAVWLTYPLL